MAGALDCLFGLSGRRALVTGSSQGADRRRWRPRLAFTDANGAKWCAGSGVVPAAVPGVAAHAGIVPVAVVYRAGPAPVGGDEMQALPAGTIEIVLPNGCRLRVQEALGRHHLGVRTKSSCSTPAHFA